MTPVYYNEFDPFAADWLRQLIAAGHLPAGDVDTRSIVDVRPADLAGYAQCHFFAGVGGWPLALLQAGWPSDRSVWTGSCPCQPFSAIGQGDGFADERHLWPHWHYLVTERRPPVVFGEQVASKDGLAWLDLVFDDMEGEDYAIWAVDLCAAGAGSPHKRQRLNFVAHSLGAGLERQPGDVCRAPGRQIAGRSTTSASPTGGFWEECDWVACRDGYRRPVEPGTFPLAHGSTARVGRLRGYGNAIVVPASQLIVEAYLEAIDVAPIHETARNLDARSLTAELLGGLL